MLFSSCLLFCSYWRIVASMRGMSPLKIQFLAESLWHVVKYAQSSDFSVGCHQWMPTGSISAFLKYVLSSAVGNLLVHHHAPVSESWNWVLSAIQMRTLIVVVLNWPKIQVMHILKPNQTKKKKKGKTKQTKRLQKKPLWYCVQTQR